MKIENIHVDSRNAGSRVFPEIILFPTAFLTHSDDFIVKQNDNRCIVLGDGWERLSNEFP
jgi:hypothetical protein